MLTVNNYFKHMSIFNKKDGVFNARWKIFNRCGFKSTKT